jgi:hypothetical protein
MSEEDVRDGLRGAVADEPPLDFDPETVVTEARQQIKRRRSLIAAGVATAAVVVAAVAIPVALGRGGTTQVAQQPTTRISTTTSPTTTEWTSPAQLVSYTADQLRTLSQKMATHLRGTLPEVLPEASKFEYGEFGGEAAGQFFDGQNYVNAPVTFTIDHARYSIFVAVWVPGAPEMSPERVCDTAAYCKQFGEKDGGKLVSKTENTGDQTIVTVYHLRPNGGVIQVAAYNYDMTAAAPKSMPDIKVTIQQLATVATDPALGL